MNILFFSSHSHFSGEHKMALALARAAKDAGHNVLIGAPEESFYLEEAAKRGFKTSLYKAPESLLVNEQKATKRNVPEMLGRFIVSWLPYTIKTAYKLRAQNIDLAYVAQERSIFQIGFGLKLAGIPILWHAQGNAKNKKILMPSLASALSKRILCVSKAIKSSLPKSASKKTSVLYNGLPDIEPKEQSKDKKTKILYAGNIAPERGAHILLEAAMTLPEETTHVTIAGWPINEEYEEYLNKTLSRYRVEHIEMTGHNENINDMIQDADIIVCPSIDHGMITLNGKMKSIGCTEGLGLTAIEAMSASKPVICSGVHGLKEVVEHNVTGTHVPADDVHALSEALEILTRDADLRMMMGNAGRKRFEAMFTQEKMFDGFLSVLNEFKA